MTNSSSKHAWPLKQYDGSIEGYEEYEVDKEAWLIDNGYDKHVRKTDPSTIPRVRESYEVSDPADPNGRVGDWIHRERRQDYKDRCERFAAKDKKIWAKAIPGYTGAARQTALLAPKFKAKALFDKVKSGQAKCICQRDAGKCRLQEADKNTTRTVN